MEPELITIFVAGFVMGFILNYMIGRMVFNIFAVKAVRKITPRTTFMFEVIQHPIGYTIGFLIGILTFLRPFLLLIMIPILALTVIISMKVFKFKKAHEGILFTSVDYFTDAVVGVIFGTGTALTVIHLGLMHL